MPIPKGFGSETGALFLEIPDGYGFGINIMNCYIMLDKKKKNFISLIWDGRICLLILLNILVLIRSLLNPGIGFAFISAPRQEESTQATRIEQRNQTWFLQPSFRISFTLFFGQSETVTRICLLGSEK